LARRHYFDHLTLCVAVVAFGTLASANEVIRIGVLTDMSGPYSDIAGRGSVAAAELAVEELGGKVGERRIEIVSADHQNKPDVGSAIARNWFDRENVDIIVDVITSSVALAVQSIAKDKNKIVIFSGAGADQLTGESSFAAKAAAGPTRAIEAVKIILRVWESGGIEAADRITLSTVAGPFDSPEAKAAIRAYLARVREK
jgi:enoyl-CoA hydratase/carnithine racemase